MWTIDELVDLFHPTGVAVNNPRVKGEPTHGNCKVWRFEVETDGDEIFLWVTI